MHRGDEFISEETNQKLESARLAARQDAARHSNFPTFLDLNGVRIPLAKYSELESLKLANIKQRAKNLVDSVNSTGSRFFEHYSHLAYKPGAADVITLWIIDVQVQLAVALGHSGLDAQAFGAPPRENMWDVNVGRPDSDRQPPCWSQPDLENRMSNQWDGTYAPAAAMKQQQRHVQQQQRPTTASRFDDAARIRMQNSRGNVMLG